MRIMIASTIVPFIEGGGTFIVDWTAKKLVEHGHEVEIFKIPFSHYPDKIIQQMLALRLLKVSETCDRLISIRTPSYLLNHPNHICWFIHHYRLVYELWNTDYQTEIAPDVDGLRLKDTIVNSDNLYLRKLKKIFTNSIEVSDRLKQFNNIDSEVLYPPLMDAEMFKLDNYGEYIYYSSRVAFNKRQMLAVEAMKYTKTDVKLVITGKSDSPSYADSIQKFIEDNNLKSKIKFEDRWITKEEKIELFSKCLAGIYIPFDEDSYGYPSLEAFSSRKAVITCTDSGGTNELIINNENGLIIEPRAEDLAKAMDNLYKNRAKTRNLGYAAYESLKNKGITWDLTIDKLTARY